LLTIDGSEGEGGGQILRSSLALSVATGTPFRISNIRARRRRTGLLRQHLTAVQAAAAISDAKIEGARLGSTELVFEPGDVRAGTHEFSIGSAGSASLVLQTILLPLSMAEDPSEIVVEGGTYNPLAPPFDFLEKSYLPLLERMGVKVTATHERAGFAPEGGGRIRARIEPGTLTSLTLEEPGRLVRRRAVSTLAGLPTHILGRELAVLRDRLGLHGGEQFERILPPEEGPGNALHIELEYEHVTLVLTSFGEKGLPAEIVAARLSEEARRVTRAQVATDEHLADQLVLPMALGDGGSFTTLEPTPHLRTQAEVIRAFLEHEVQFEKLGRDRYRVTVST
jgi:RNA 3'-terminal phosphate cyclase (ATP)